MTGPIDRVLRSQHQLIHRKQAIAAGISGREIDNHVRARRWHTVYPSVYCVGAPPAHLHAEVQLRVRAVGLWAGPNAIVASATAGWWHGLTAALPTDIHIMIGRSRRLSPQPGIVLHRRVLDPLDVRSVRGVLVTSRERTALDLAASGCTDALDLMLREGSFNIDLLTEALDRGAHQAGWARARAALAESVTRPFSVAERTFHRLLKQASIVGWRANVALRIGERTVVPDVLFEALGLVVEIDGREHHADPRAFEADRVRQNLLMTAGFTVLRFTWHQLVNDPDEVLRQLVGAMARLAHSAGQ